MVEKGQNHGPGVQVAFVKLKVDLHVKVVEIMHLQILI